MAGPVDGGGVMYSPDDLLTPAEAASVLNVKPKTVGGYARAGLLNSCRTVGGHRRYRYAALLAFTEQRRRGRTPKPQPDLLAQVVAALKKNTT